MKHNTISPADGQPTPAHGAKEASDIAREPLSLASTTWRVCGHPKTPENTRRVGSGEVRCRTCRTIIDQRSRERKRGAA